MIKQYDFSFKIDNLEKVQSEIAVKLHGFLMNQIPTSDAELLHEKKYHPFSIYCYPSANENVFLARISTLNSSANSLIDTAQSLDYIHIPKLPKIRILQKEQPIEYNYNQLGNNIDSNRVKLIFLTPSCFKVADKNTSFPDLTMHFLSVLNKMRAFENENITLDDFRNAFYKCKILNWNLNNFNYNISGRYYPGMVGEVELILPKDIETEHLLKKIFCYATFSGTGGKTGMGMGGFLVEFK